MTVSVLEDKCKKSSSNSTRTTSKTQKNNLLKQKDSKQDVKRNAFKEEKGQLDDQNHKMKFLDKIQ